MSPGLKRRYVYTPGERNAELGKQQGLMKAIPKIIKIDLEYSLRDHA